ncbi:MAG: ATP synthase F1 subunit gamma [Chloroflexi bacterium]|nr:ATP synthase F1 subunit gamma [Chloroflexota bacterium]
MANIRLIRMEIMATSKMRRAQERDLASRPYSTKIRQVLGDLAAQHVGKLSHPLLDRREIKKIEIIHITPDRGLCGGLNSNINRSTAAFILQQTTSSVMVTVGRKGRDFMLRYGREFRAEFTGIGDKPSLLDTLPISRIVIDDYAKGFVDQVLVSYTEFVSTMTQRPVMHQLLPVEPAKLEHKGEIEYIYEPSSKEVLAQLLPRFVEVEVYHALLESIASEQSSRMVAMRNATENANELVQDLTLAYNKARQDMITKEILDITGGAEALA